MYNHLFTCSLQNLATNVYIYIPTTIYQHQYEYIIYYEQRLPGSQPHNENIKYTVHAPVKQQA